MALLLSLSVLAVIYLLSLPTFVQGGDTGELVAAAYRLLVPHPPGYPLWIWLEHVWTHLCPLGTIFWKASFLNMLFAVLTLLCIGYPLRKDPLKLTLCIFLLGLSTAFSEAAILPDVFSLHALMTASIGSLYFFLSKTSKLRAAGIPFLFALGMSNHHTTLFLLPVVIDVMIEGCGDRALIKILILGGLSGLILTGLLYSSLLFLHPESPYSWGNLNSITTLWYHFIRADYGTFKLSPGSTISTSEHAPFRFFFSSSALEIVGLVTFTIWIVLRNSKLKLHSRPTIWAFSCILSISFFLFCNISTIGAGAEVIQRFHVMPLVQVVLLCSYLISKVRLQKIDILLGIGSTSPALLLLVLNLPDLLTLHKDSTIEDYSRNLLQQATRYSPSVVITHSDSAYFGMRYLQSVFLSHEGAIPIVPSLFFHSWYLTKVHTLLPTFQLPHAEKIWNQRQFNLEGELIEPNIKTVSFLVERGFQEGKSFHLTFLPVGRKLSRGSGISFDESWQNGLMIRTTYQGPPVGPQKYSRGLLYGSYAHYFLEKGLEAFKKNKKEMALDFWSKALSRVDYAYPALYNICRVTEKLDPRCTRESMEQIKHDGHGFF